MQLDHLERPTRTVLSAIVPLAAPLVDLPQLRPLMSACVAIDLFLAIPLFTMVLSRLVTGEPMPAQQQATVMILVAPFAVGYLAYVAATGRVDGFAEALLSILVFLVTVLLGTLRRLVSCCPFRTGWWAAGFPLAAAANGALGYTHDRPGALAGTISFAFLCIATVTIAALTLRTAVGIARGELRDLV